MIIFVFSPRLTFEDAFDIYGANLGEWKNRNFILSLFLVNTIIINLCYSLVKDGYTILELVFSILLFYIFLNNLAARCNIHVDEMNLAGIFDFSKFEVEK